MRRGTTPTNKFRSNVDLRNAEIIYLSYAQDGKVVIERSLPDITVTEERLEIKLTQKETLALDARKYVEIQARVKLPGDTAIGSNIIKTTVKRILKDGEI